jgi:hypothetical protein
MPPAARGVSRSAIRRRRSRPAIFSTPSAAEAFFRDVDREIDE